MNTYTITYTHPDLGLTEEKVTGDHADLVTAKRNIAEGVGLPQKELKMWSTRQADAYRPLVMKEVDARISNEFVDNDGRKYLVLDTGPSYTIIVTREGSTRVRLITDMSYADVVKHHAENVSK